MWGFRRQPGATGRSHHMLGRELRSPASIGPLHSALLLLPPPPPPTFPSQGLAASAAPGHNCIILGFVCRAAGGGAGGPQPPPPSPSHRLLSWVLLLLPLSQAPGTRGWSALPGDSQFPFPLLRSQGALEAAEAKRRRLGAGSAPGWKPQLKAGATFKRSAWL